MKNSMEYYMEKITWNHFRFSHKKVTETEGRMTIYRNGVEMETHDTPGLVEPFRNVKVYRSAPHYPSVADDCDVKDLTIKQKNF